MWATYLVAAMLRFVRQVFSRRTPVVMSSSLQAELRDAAEQWFARDQREIELRFQGPLTLEGPLRGTTRPTMSVMSDAPHDVVTLSLWSTAGGGHELRATLDKGFVAPLVTPWPAAEAWWRGLTRWLCTPKP